MNSENVPHITLTFWGTFTHIANMREGSKIKTLGRRYPKVFLPNVPSALCTSAFETSDVRE